MNPNDVIESYVAEVMRRVPRADRNEVGLELRGLLGEMLEERAGAAGRVADDAMVLALLRDFGSPEQIAARYRPPGMVIIRPEHARSFARWALGGVAVQWALTLPQVFDGSLHLVGWWFRWGLGALWWPGFMVVMSMLAAWLRSRGLFQPRWTPRIVDPDRVDRGTVAIGLAASVLAIGGMIALPWLVDRLPGVLPAILEFDPSFLQDRAWPVLVLWAAGVAALLMVLANGRHTTLSRWLEAASSVAFVALLGWWMSAGPIFVQPATNDGARGGLALVILLIVVDLAAKLWRGRPGIRTPQLRGL